MSKNIGKKVRPKPREKPEDVQKYAGPLTTFASSDFDETGLPKPAEYSQTDKGKSVRISLHLIAKRHLPLSAKEWPQDKILEELNKISHVRLDRENISDIDHMELLGPRVTNLYLQSNKIKTIEGLESLRSLKFIALANNCITRIQGLICLTQLAFLDLSENAIKKLDLDELPPTLIILNMAGNPCTKTPNYRGRVIGHLAGLKVLDDERISKTERMDAGYDVSSDEEESEEDEEDDDEELQLDQAAAGVRDEGNIQSHTTDILLRSQSRMEEYHSEHKRRLVELDKFREDNAIPPSPRLNPTQEKPTTATAQKGPTQQSPRKSTTTSKTATPKKSAGAVRKKSAGPKTVI